jgi:hypothetical protein
MTIATDLSPRNRLVTLPDSIPDLTLGWGAVKFANKYFRHPNGPHAGEKWDFTLTQVRFLLWWYAIDENGRWLYHHGVRRLAKGSGKSPFAGVLALTEFCGPVRLLDFDSNVRGGAVGQPVSMPLVQIAATAESQTANTMRMVRALAGKDSLLVNTFSLDYGKTKYYKTPEGTLEIITSSSGAAEGAESSFIVADETEHWIPGNGGPELASTLSDNLAKSGSRMLETSNAWRPGKGSVAEDTYNAWLAQEEGRVKSDTKILYDARMAPADTNLADEDSLLRGLQMVYDDCFWIDPKFLVSRIWDPRSKVDDSKRKYLNWPTAAEDAWIREQDWLPLAEPREVKQDEEIVMFFDGSKSRDATALVGCAVSDGYTFLIGAWEPHPTDDTDVVPVGDVDARVHQAFGKYKVLAFFADVKEWEGFTKVTWPAEFSDKLIIMATPGTKEPQSIAWDMRTRTQEFTLAAELTQTEIWERGFRHDGNAVLTRHVINARVRETRWGQSIGKESPNSPYKIDAAVCLIGAQMVRRVLLASDAYQKYKNKQRGRGRVIVLA